VIWAHVPAIKNLPNRHDFLSARREGDRVGRGHFNNSYFLLAVMLCYVSVP
jgi:hypothetical protein